MMRSAGCWMGVWLLVASGVMGGDAAAYRWKREVQIPAVPETSLIAVPLDSHVYACTRDGWPDVTVRNEKGEGMGFVIVTHSTSKKANIVKTWEGEKSGVQLDEKNGLQVELTLKDADPQPEALVIQTPLRDFAHQVKVETSKDGKAWEGAGAALIFDYSRFVDARNDRVALPKGDYRRVRITIGDVTAEQESQLLEMKKQFADGKEIQRTEETAILRRPFRIDRIQFVVTTEEATGASVVETVEYVPQEVHLGPTVNSTEGLDSYASIELHREPVTEIEVETVEENFSRRAIVSQLTPSKISKAPDEREVGRGVLTRFSVGAIKKNEMFLLIPETRANDLSVKVINGDSAALRLKGVKLRGPQYYLEFLAAPGGKYVLEYGSEEAKPRQYDTAALSVAREANQSRVLGRLAVVETGAGQVIAKPWEFGFDSRILIAVVVVMTLLLGFALYRAAKRMDLPGG